MSTEASFSSLPEPAPRGAGSPDGRIATSGANAPDATPPMAPGDQAPAGTPGTGEDVCPACGGSGRVSEGTQCPDCEGTGKLIVGIGGA